MEAQALAAASAATGSRTLADLLTLAVEKHANCSAQRYKDQARDVGRRVVPPSSGETVRELSLGLQDIGIEAREKVGILCQHQA